MRGFAMLALLMAMFVLAACENEVAKPQTAGSVTPEASQPPQITQANDQPDAAAKEPAPTVGAAVPRITTGDSREIEWDDLIPDDYQPEKLLGDLDLEDLSDDDPRAREAMEKLTALWDQAPVRDDLDGRDVRLPGFIVPVEADENETTGFLLVPYYGACVHVPPPPANQTVYVITETGKGARPELFDVIWVSGTMSVKRIDNDIAEAGYTLYAHAIEPYE